MNSSEITRLLNDTVDLLSQTSTMKGLCRRHRHGDPLPSGQVLAEVIDLCRAVLFPGYYGKSVVNADTVLYTIGVSVERLFFLLRHQIEAGLCFENDDDSDQAHADMHLRARSMAAELIRRIENNDADLIAVEMDIRPYAQQLTACGAFTTTEGNNRKSWAVGKGAPELAKALDEWYRPELKKAVQEEEQRRFLPQFSVRRKPRAPFLSRSQGIISPYDAHFKRHGGAIGWDWRLMAAQCYQESAFDPNAVSWAGAQGLMQIMPSTAQHLNLPMEQIYHPEKNIQAAARYLRELEYKFSDIQPRTERMWFALAAYNGGAGHIQDARTLARQAGKNANRWDEVKHFVLRLSNPGYYNRKEVRFGYMRGSETYQYVESIRQRWNEYRRVAKPERVPQKAKGERKKKFR